MATLRIWDNARICQLVERKFKVQYNSQHIGTLLHPWDGVRRNRSGAPLERKEEDIERWKKKDWARDKKTLRGLGAHISLCR